MADFIIGFLIGIFLVGLLWTATEQTAEHKCEEHNNVYDCERSSPWYVPAEPEPSDDG